MDSFKFPDSSVTPNGGFEFVMDVSPETRFTYDNGQSNTLVDVYSAKNIKGNLGFEVIFTNDSTLSLNYERFQHLDFDRSGKTETFIVKIGKIIEGDSEFAFNYDPLANSSDNSCEYPEQYQNCDGSCMNGEDLQGNCIQVVIEGCMDEAACNYDIYANTDTEPSLCIYFTEYLDCNGECYLDEDANGICDACNYHEIKNNIDWEEREKKLIKLCDKYRKKFSP